MKINSTVTNVDRLVKELINLFIQDIIVEKTDLESPRLQYKARLSEECNNLLEGINRLIYENVIQSQRVQTMEWKVNLIVTKLFDAFMDTAKLLPKDRRYKDNLPDAKKGRIVCDYIAGMTDKYAENFYRRLFVSNGGRLFDL